LLLVDVDGVISLFGFDQRQPPPGRWLMADGNPHYVSAAAGELLRELATMYELVWCTGWEERANDYLPHALSLGDPLPYLSFDRNPGRGNTHWKLAAIDAFAGTERGLAWIDDALDDACRVWAAQRPGPTLLVDTEPAVGITPAHGQRLIAWARLIAS
jgi:Swiss Army Knife RNA repair-like protein